MLKQFISKNIRDGASQPKQCVGAMPPSGDVNLSSEDLTAVPSYIWAVGHRQSVSALARQGSDAVDAK